MTKKFWDNWQKRIGETKKIYVKKEYKYGWHSNLIIGAFPFTLLSAKFHGDTVDLIIIEYYPNAVTHRCNSEKKHLTLKREEISTVKF